MRLITDRAGRRFGSQGHQVRRDASNILVLQSAGQWLRVRSAGAGDRAAEPRHRAGAPNCGNKWGDHDCLWPERFVGRQDDADVEEMQSIFDRAMPKRYD